MKNVFLSASLFALLVAACKKETQPAEENEGELITTIQLEFTQRSSGERSTFLWEDVDGPGGDLPVIDTIRIEDNSVYDVKVSFWNRSVTPAEDITAEVKSESESHRVYYEPSAGAGITVNGFDNDVNGIPLGTTSVWTTGDSSSGTVLVVLRHYAEGGKAADDPLSSPKSSTDAGAAFEVVTGD